MPPGVLFSRPVTFVLAGRTTLSEHCPTEHIDVDYAIAERSPYLRIYLPQHVRDDRPLLPIQLGDVDPAGFKLYIEWLTNGFVGCSTQKSLRLDSCIDLIFAHIVGSTFSQPHFQDYIIDTLAFILDPAQVFDQEVLELLFLEKHATSALRQFITDKMFGHDRRMLGMMRNSVEDVVTAYSDVKGCEYHIHQDGVCYKYGRADEDQVAIPEAEIGEKKWNIDDDPELNAMAAQYLGKTKTNASTKEKSSTSSRRTLKIQERSLAPERKRPPLERIYTSNPSVVESRILHIPQQSIRSIAANIVFDKPLPTLPPTSRSASSSPLTLAASLQSSTNTPNDDAVKVPSTQDLVLECLERLSSTATRDRVDEFPAQSTIDIEALPTLPPSPPLNPCSDTLQTSSPNDIPPSLRPGSPPSTYPTCNLTFAPCLKPKSPSSSPRSTTKRKVTPFLTPLNQPPHNVSHTPTLRFSPSQSPPLLIQRPYHISPSSPSLPHFAPLVRRKPAPLRGLDWLRQQDTLFALQGTQGFGQRKGYQKNVRKSRFMKMLGSVGKVDEDSGRR